MCANRSSKTQKNTNIIGGENREKKWLVMCHIYTLSHAMCHISHVTYLGLGINYVFAKLKKKGPQFFIFSNTLFDQKSSALLVPVADGVDNNTSTDTATYRLNRPMG